MIPASAVRGDDPYEMLIKSIVTIESQPKLALTKQKSEHERMKGVFTDFSKMLSDLKSSLQRLSDPVTPLFGARRASTTANAFTVSATDRASLGTHSLEVVRLASNDMRVSRQFDNAATSLRQTFDQPGNASQSFSIEVHSPTADEPDRRVGIAVDVTPTGSSDAEILAEIETATREAIRSAVDSGLIKSSEAPNVSLVNETSGTTRLSLRSAESGYSGRLSFVDSSGGLLSELGITADSVVEGTAGGMVTAVGTSETDSALNASFKLDGLTLYRSTNRVDDALAGITLNLQRVSTEPSSFRVESNEASIKEGIETFIKRYNEVLTYIERRSRVDADAGTRGDFAGDSAIRSLRMNLRNDIAQSFGAATAQAGISLSDLGITTERDGTLKLADASKLTAALAESPDALRQLFGGDDGVATRIEQRLENFVGSKGLLAERSASMDSRIKRIDSRIKTFEATLSRREDSLRLQFGKMQETIAVLQGQQNFFLSYFQSAYF
jgi:flagellar hook-associated protein 2